MYPPIHYNIILHKNGIKGISIEIQLSWDIDQGRVESSKVEKSNVKSS